MTIVTVRCATVEDAPEIARIRIEGWRAAYTQLVAPDVLDAMDETADSARWATRIATEPDIHTLVAELEGEQAGFCTYGDDRDEPQPRRAEIYAIYVAPQFWGCGAGVALLESALADVGLRGVTEIRLWTLTGNARARRFYERHGFGFDANEKPLTGLLDPDGATATEVRYVRTVEG
jgi:ribosomal protein S18 acetylase RimI-like enzyme